ncbi:Uncharacterised protein [uncultured archaeon]|nr:Uncharacterised protein [uncultured archaeon]
MSVIINEFEITSQKNETSQDEAPQTSGLTPDDIINIIRNRDSRISRLRAH